MTPAVNTVKKNKVAYKIHQYTHDPAHSSYGQEAADVLGIDPSQVFKTLVVELDGKELAVAVIPVSGMLNMKAFAKAANAKKAAMADKSAAERSTGYVLGGISPLGQKRRLKTIIDSSAQDSASMFVSAGKRGLEIELAANDLATLSNASFYRISTSDD